MARSPVSHILVLVDGTQSSYRTADYAIDLARAVGARITALAVVDTDTLRQLLNVRILVDAEMAEFRRKLAALELQIEELDKLGEVEEANQLREQLEELKKALRK